MELTDIYNEFRTSWESFKKVDAQREAEIKQHGVATAETKNSLSELNKRLDQLEVKMQRPMSGVGGFDSPTVRDEHKAFQLALRYGVRRLSDEQKALIKIATPGQSKALSMGDDTAGGFLATPEFIDQIIKNVVLISPIRSYANVVKTSNYSVNIPVRTSTMAATWVSETGQRLETAEPKYGNKQLPNHELYSLSLISKQLIDDAAFNMEQQIEQDAAEQFAQAEGAAFVSGSGMGQPEGFLTNAAVATVANGGATLTTADGMMSLFYNGVKTAYGSSPNARWYLRRETIGAVRKLKDNYGQYLWQPGIAGAQPSTIMDVAYVETPDMPLIAAGTFPIVFGDMKRAYTLVDRVEMEVQRLVEKYAESGQIAYLISKRVGGQVVLAEAIAKLQMA